MEVQVNTENSKSVFRYIEIQFNWTLVSDYSKFSQWLACNQNDNFLDRFIKKYGHFKTVILVNYGPVRVKHDDINIVELLNDYGNEGWEIISTRSNDLIFPPNYDLEDTDRRNSLYYSRNTIYSLKKLMTKQELIKYNVKLKELQEEMKNSNEYSDNDSNEIFTPEFPKLDSLDDSVYTESEDS
ncbi:MAG: hypothetical protein ACRCU2_29215 [Planktothrix sp.]